MNLPENLSIVDRAQLVCKLALGVDGYEHACRVVRIAEEAGFPETEKVVAWLHDVIEDSEWTMDDLYRLGGFPERVRNNVGLLTRDDEETYRKYIDRMCDRGDVVAIRVKLADIQDHLEFGYYIHGSSLRPRYERAKVQLTEALKIAVRQ